MDCVRGAAWSTFLATDVTDALPWCYVRDQWRRRRSRRYCLAKVVVGSRTGYFFEIERRLTQADGGDVSATEQFRGFAFTLGNPAAFREVLPNICDLVKLRKGVLEDMDIAGAETVVVYTHHFDKHAMLNAMVRRVLKRLGLIPKKRDSAATTNTTRDESNED